MTDKIKEWDEYFGQHCHLPAAAIRDLFEHIAELEADLMACGDARGIEGMNYENRIAKLEAKAKLFDKYASHLEAKVERLRAVYEAAKRSRETDEYGLLSVEKGWELDRTLAALQEADDD